MSTKIVLGLQRSQKIEWADTAILTIMDRWSVQLVRRPVPIVDLIWTTIKMSCLKISFFESPTGVVILVRSVLLHLLLLLGEMRISTLLIKTRCILPKSFVVLFYSIAVEVGCALYVYTFISQGRAYIQLNKAGWKRTAPIGSNSNWPFFRRRIHAILCLYHTAEVHLQPWVLVIFIIESCVNTSTSKLDVWNGW